MIASFDIGEVNFAYAIGTKDALSRWRLTNVVKTKSQSVTDSCAAVTEVLNDEDWSECDAVIIESQVKPNARAARVAQHVWTWFSVMHPRTNPRFVPASMKTQKILGKNALNNRSRKAWAVSYVIGLLIDRKDVDNFQYLNSLKKKDDVCDAYLQLVAYCS